MKKRLTLAVTLLIAVCCLTFGACKVTDKPNTPDNPSKEYRIVLDGEATRSLTAGDTDVINWTVMYGDDAVTDQEVEIALSSDTVVEKTAGTATSATIKALAPGRVRVTIKLKDKNVTVSVTYTVSKPSFWGATTGTFAAGETDATATGGQSTALTRVKGSVWMFSAKLNITDYTSTETVAVGSFVDAGNSALWFGLQNNDGKADGRFSVYIRNFLKGWGQATTDQTVTGYSRYTGTTEIPVVLIRNGTSYYYSIAGMFGSYVDNTDTSIETYAGVQTQNQAVTVTDFSMETDADLVQAAISVVCPEDKVGAVSITVPSNMSAQIVSGSEGARFTLTADCYANGEKLADKTVTWSIDTNALIAGSATIDNGLLRVAGETEGVLTITATYEDVSDVISVKVINKELVDENELFTMKGGVRKIGDDGIEFPEEYVGSANIPNTNEGRYTEDYTYRAMFKNKLVGNFSIEFTVSDYKTSSQFPKLMFSFGADTNNIYLVYGEHTRFEAFANKNNAGILQGNWYQGEGMEGMIDRTGAVRYRIAVEGGVYKVYAYLNNTWTAIKITQDGANVPMIRKYEDFTKELPLLITAKELSCKISDVIVTNGSASDNYRYASDGFVSYNDMYEFSDDGKGFTVGFASDGWNGKWGSTSAIRTTAVPDSYKLTYKIKFSKAMDDAKFVAIIGNVSFMINNKLNSNVIEAARVKLNADGNEDWGSQVTKTVATANEDVTVVITRTSEGVLTFYVNDQPIVTEASAAYGTMKIYTFNAAADQIANNGYEVIVSDFNLGDYEAYSTWKAFSENLTVKVNKEKTLAITVKHDGINVTEGYTVNYEYDGDVVSVNNGKIKGLKTGTADITVKITADDAVVATFVVTVTVPEVRYEVGFGGISGDETTVKIYGELDLKPYVKADAEVSAEYELTFEGDCIELTGGIVKGLKTGDATVTVAAKGTNVSKTITVHVSDEINHNYALSVKATEELYAGDEGTITVSASDNGQVLAGENVTISFKSSSEGLTVADGKITTVEALFANATEVTITVNLAVDGEVVKTETVTVNILATVYAITINNEKTELRTEYGLDTSDVTYKVLRNNVETKLEATAAVNGDAVTYANGVVKGVKDGTATLTFTYGKASNSVTYAVTATIFNSTRARGTVTYGEDGKSVTVNGGSGVAFSYPAKVWKVTATVTYSDFASSESGATVVGFTSGKNSGDTFNNTLILGITSGDVMGMRYVCWFDGWMNKQSYINLDGYNGLALNDVFTATRNKTWELIRLNDEYYFSYGDFFGKFVPVNSDKTQYTNVEATFPGIFAQFGCGFTASDIELDYDIASVTAAAQSYSDKSAYGIELVAPDSQTLGTELDLEYRLIPSFVEEEVTFKLNTENLVAGTATIAGNKVTLSQDAKGSYTVIATTAGGKTAEAIINATGDRIYTENDYFKTYGTDIKMTDDGETGYKIVFNNANVNGVVKEPRYIENTEFSANYKKTLTGDFSVEFTVSDYKATAEYPKLMVSFGGRHAQFYIAYKPNGEYRIETLSEHEWADGGFSTDDGAWSNTKNFENFDTTASHAYKIDLVNGVFHLYVDGVEYKIQTDNNTHDTYAIRRYEDWKTAQPMRISTNGCTAVVSNIKITEKGTSNSKYVGFTSVNRNYDEATDTLTTTMNSKGWSTPELYYVPALPEAYKVSFDVNFSDAMTDAKLGIRLGGRNTFWLENKLNGTDKKLNLSMDENWVSGDWTYASNATVHIEITVAADKSINITIQAEGGEAATRTLPSTRDGSMLSFYIFNENSDDAAKTVSIKNLTVTAL